ncbi:hypothetical protein M527_06570 [Sphingobium indicum IP26]|uniref:ClpX-type ZB domain-containing protein n=1 Tax=Sphingobium indicum F2 TaxID=1450518 RepID=A0A8E1C3H1_9SPHN|nr:hypothetical protein M527_06570 [Sphingobium indicum IP26]KER37265.1 hypothetical protein AL00_06215 [Sphingobium indicum F2]
MTPTHQIGRGEGQTLYCSFCARSQHEALVLIAGPTVFICEECVDLSAAIVAEKRSAHSHRDMVAADIGCAIAFRVKG